MSMYDLIVGHEKVISQLKNAVRNDMVNHAYILNGGDGAGKKMVAMAFAEALLCEKGLEEGCGECHFCKQTAQGNNPDLKVIDAEGKNILGVDRIRESVVDDVAIRPYNGRSKVYIIDEAEKMNAAAQNAILKTLEEPPEYSVIIFLTNNVEVFLPTIISRCTVLNLYPLRESTVMEYLISEYRIPEYKAKVCATYSQGLLGKARKLAQSEEFSELKDEAVKIVTDIYSYEILDIIETVKQTAGFKNNINDLIDIMEMWYRDVLLFKVTKDPNNLIFGDQINIIRKQASRCSYEGIENILKGCETAKKRLKANVNFDLAIELMLLNIKEN